MECEVVGSNPPKSSIPGSSLKNLLTITLTLTPKPWSRDKLSSRADGETSIQIHITAQWIVYSLWHHEDVVTRSPFWFLCWELKTSRNWRWLLRGHTHTNITTVRLQLKRKGNTGRASGK